MASSPPGTVAPAVVHSSLTASNNSEATGRAMAMATTHPGATAKKLRHSAAASPPRRECSVATRSEISTRSGATLTRVTNSGEAARTMDAGSPVALSTVDVACNSQATLESTQLVSAPKRSPSDALAIDVAAHCAGLTRHIRLCISGP